MGLAGDAVLEFQDSEVRDVVRGGADLVLTFSAAFVRGADARPGGDAGSGYLAGLRMVFRDAEASGELAACQGKLSQGELRVDGARARLLRLPCRAAGAVDARLQFASGAVLSIRASSIECLPSGEEKFFASYAC